MPRDNFSPRIVRRVAERASYLCSNPDCRHPTCGPHSDPTKSTITGEAAHICSAAENGPRYDINQSLEGRKAITNAIWLRGNCNKKVDTDWKAWPKERLLDMKSVHERWIAAEAMILLMPEVSLRTLHHLRLNAELQHIDAAIQATLREQELVIRNPNRVELHLFTLDLCLPELVVKSGQKQFHTGAVVRFLRVQPDMVGVIRGEGSVTAGPPVPTTQCRVEIEKLPASSESRLAFYTIAPDDTMPTMPYSPGPMGREFFGNPEDMETTKVCHFYMGGTYQFVHRGEFVKGTLFVPILFIAAERRATSLPVQQTTEPYKVFRFTMGSGATIRVGMVQPE
jgi:hypothetical protein